MPKETLTALEVCPGKAPQPITYCYDAEKQQYTFPNKSALYHSMSLEPAAEPNVAILSFWDAILFDLPPNRRWAGSVIYGDFFVVGCDADGNLCSLDADMIKKYTELFATPEVFDLNELFSAMDF